MTESRAAGIVGAVSPNMDFARNNIKHEVKMVNNGFKRYTYIDFVYNKSEFKLYSSIFFI
jgi:hypothetical protein